MSLVIPAHNEAANIGAVLDGVRAVLGERGLDWELVLVDDASSDGTTDAARAALGEDAERLLVVRHETQRGYAATVGDGLAAAHGRLLAFMDGDRQFDARDLGRLIDRISDADDADMVAGVRAKRADPWHRSVVSGVMNLLVRSLYGIRRRDVDCGLKVFRREVYERASPLLARSALFNTELYFKADRLGFRVEQLAVQHLPRVAGRRSGARLIPILRALRDVVILRLRLARRWRPGTIAGTSASSAVRAWLLFTSAVVLFAIARLPSFWEPHWYTDEAGYVTTAQTLLGGHALYSQIWTNKPPLTVLMVAAVVHFFGTGEAALHLLTAASGLAAVGAVFWAAWRLLGPRRAVVASLIVALALGLPVLDAELILPESLLIAPIAWAGALIAVRISARRDGAPPPRGFVLWPFVAGALVAAAIAMQQSALAETLAFTLALLMSPVARFRDAASFLGTVVLITGGWLAAVIAMAGVHTVAFALVGFYIPFTQSVLPGNHVGTLLHFGAALAAGLLFAGGALLQRRSPRPTWFFLLWAGAALMVAGVSGQPYAHYLTPAAAPVALCLASIHRIPLRRVTRARVAAGLRIAPQLTGVLIAAFMASNAGLDWVPSPTPSSLLNGQPINNSRNFDVYYGGALAAVFGLQTRDDWAQGFDSRVPGDVAAAGYIKSEGLAGAPAVVWSSDAWLYALAELPNLMPTPPIYNDEVLLGQNGQVSDYVANLNPMIIVTSTDALAEFPEIQKLLSANYISSFWYYPDTVWVRADVAAQLP
ncbi:MAG TPA: glycosyltransferase [Candidatus Dormibacteraeota bacterium]